LLGSPDIYDTEICVLALLHITDVCHYHEAITYSAQHCFIKI